MTATLEPPVAARPRRRLPLRRFEPYAQVGATVVLLVGGTI